MANINTLTIKELNSNTTNKYSLQDAELRNTVEALTKVVSDQNDLINKLIERINNQDKIIAGIIGTGDVGSGGSEGIIGNYLPLYGGTITGSLKVNGTITATNIIVTDKVQSKTVIATNINGTNIEGTTVNGTTINGTTIKGDTVEGAVYSA